MIIGIDLGTSNSLVSYITGYSLHYKPRRFFYQNFFEKYVGGTDESISNFMAELFKTRKPVALKILHIFSDPNYIADLLSKEQIAFSDKLFKHFCENNIEKSNGR